MIISSNDMRNRSQMMGFSTAALFSLLNMNFQNLDTNDSEKSFKLINTIILRQSGDLSLLLTKISFLGF